LLLYLDDFLFMAMCFLQCARLARKAEADFVQTGLKINVPKCRILPAQYRRQLGFDVDFADGKFRVPIYRWEALHESVERFVGARHGRGLPRGKLEGDI